MDDKAEKVALFRYGLIAPLVLETLPRGELTRRAQQIAARLYDFPHSTRHQVSVDTLLDWTLRYRRNGLDALSPKPRQDRGQARAVAPETAALIERLKRENPHRTGAALLRELATATGLPCAAGFPIGHGSANEAVPLGVRVRLDADARELTFLGGAVA